MSEPAFAAEPAARDEPAALDKAAAPDEPAARNEPAGLDEPAAATPETLESAEAAELARRRRSPAPASSDRQPATYRQPAAGKRVGLTGRGVVALILVATFLAGLLDMAISGHRGHVFGVVFAVSSAVGALVVRRRNVPTAMIAPPLAYCALIVVMSLIDRGGLSGGFRTTVAFYLGNAFVTGAPAIWIGTAPACLIGWYRLRR